MKFEEGAWYVRRWVSFKVPQGRQHEVLRLDSAEVVDGATWLRLTSPDGEQIYWDEVSARQLLRPLWLQNNTMLLNAVGNWTSTGQMGFRGGELCARSGWRIGAMQRAVDQDLMQRDNE